MSQPLAALMLAPTPRSSPPDRYAEVWRRPPPNWKNRAAMPTAIIMSQSGGGRSPLAERPGDHERHCGGKEEQVMPQSPPRDTYAARKALLANGNAAWRHCCWCWLVDTAGPRIFWQVVPRWAPICKPHTDISARSFPAVLCHYRNDASDRKQVRD